MLSFHSVCRLFQVRGAAHLNAFVPKSDLALDTCNKTTACDLSQELLSVRRVLREQMHGFVDERVTEPPHSE